MKRSIIICLVLISSAVSAQTFKETISKEFTFEKQSEANTLLIANVSGDVKVTGYSGDKILVEVIKTINGKTQARLEKGKTQIQIGVIDRADTLILFTDGLCSSFGRHPHKGKNHGWNGEWSYDWQDCGRNCNEEFDYSMDFTVKVPFATNLIIRTVNNGDLHVDQVRGAVSANNVNGGIKLLNLEKASEAHTINGDVTIEYARNPDKESSFYSLNGDINALFPKGLAANLSFESFNGDFFTNVDQIESLPVIVESSKNKEGIKYKVNGNRYKVGHGGVHLDFETFNGNVYLKEKE